MKALHSVAFILLVIGGLNWGILGVGGPNIVGYLGSTLSMIVYILVGLSAIYLIVTHKKTCKNCDKGAAPSGSMPM